MSEINTNTKREIPSALKNILEADVKVSKEFVEFVNKKYPIDSLRGHLKSLEISCHGNCIIRKIINTEVWFINFRYSLAVCSHRWSLH